MTFPDFIGIGAQKAGTTWLHRNLQAHPGIWMPREKELHYFDEKIEQHGWVFSRLVGKRPVDKRWRRQFGARFRKASKERSRQNLAWDLRYFFGRPDDGWYSSLFEQGRGKVTGEATPDYAILEEKTIAHVHGLMPDAKIIFMMRNPIERPWSAMEMRLRIRGHELHEVKDRKFYRRFDNKGSRLRTHYLRTLESWGSYYPEEQVFVGFDSQTGGHQSVNASKSGYYTVNSESVFVPKDGTATIDVKILRKVVRIRKQDRAKRMEEDAVLDLYLSAIGEI